MPNGNLKLLFLKEYPQGVCDEVWPCSQTDRMCLAANKAQSSIVSRKLKTKPLLWGKNTWKKLIKERKMRSF